MTEDHDQPTTLDEQLCFALYAASMAMNRVYKPMLDRLGLTYPQYLALNTLWEADELHIGAIAARLALDPSTVTPIIKRLEQAGFVTRRRDRDDERLVRVALTDAGSALRSEGTCLTAAISEKTGLDATHAHALTARLQQLRSTLADEAVGRK